MSETGSSARDYAEQFRRMREGDKKTTVNPAGSSSSYSDQYAQARSGKPGNSEKLAKGFTSYAEQAAAGRRQRQRPEVKDSAPDSGTRPEGVIPLPTSTTESLRTNVNKQLIARGQTVGFSNRLKRQLTRSERELSMIEGNLSSAGKDVKALYFTSCFEGDGKTISALYAAYGLASHGERVLLIDSNIAKPGLQQYLQSTGPGLAEVIAGTASVEMALHPTHHKGLEYMAAGTLPLGAHLSSAAMRELLEQLKTFYRYIIIDGASVFTSSEATRMAAAVDGMILVVTCEQTRWEVAQSAEEKITNAGGKVVGISMNRRKFYIPRRIYDWLSG